MTKATEQKMVLRVEGAKITKASLKISDDGKSVEFVIATETVQEQQSGVVVNTENLDEVFPIVDPSMLIGHKLLNHKPKTKWQERLLADILEGIELKLPAFRAPCMDPSEEDGKIVFKPGKKPAVGHSPVWWDKTWSKFMPSKNSRSGTDLHRAAFLGKQMKYLIEEENYSVEDAWKAVCVDSRDLGHYWNSKDANHDFEPTGSRKIGDHSDLANTFKILKKRGATYFLRAGGHFSSSSDEHPLADLRIISAPSYKDDYGVGWLVMDV